MSKAWSNQIGRAIKRHKDETKTNPELTNMQTAKQLVDLGYTVDIGFSLESKEEQGPDGTVPASYRVHFLVKRNDKLGVEAPLINKGHVVHAPDMKDEHLSGLLVETLKVALELAEQMEPPEHVQDQDQSQNEEQEA